MTALTIYVLYADDIRILSTDKDGDNKFFVSILICFFLFMFEILLLCFVRKGYICSFFFWMDIISTLSMVLEIPWVIEDLLKLGFLSDSTSIAKYMG
jgi:hypothetical protein